MSIEAKSRGPAWIRRFGAGLVEGEEVEVKEAWCWNGCWRGAESFSGTRGRRRAGFEATRKVKGSRPIWGGVSGQLRQLESRGSYYRS